MELKQKFKDGDITHTEYIDGSDFLFEGWIEFDNGEVKTITGEFNANEYSSSDYHEILIDKAKQLNWI